MRISDWSSDVCSSDLAGRTPGQGFFFRLSRRRTATMNPIRKRRLWMILALVVAAAIAATLVALALQRNVAYLYTPAEVLGGTAGEGVASGEAKFRLGGMVAEHSFKRATGPMQVQDRKSTRLNSSH